MEHQAIPVFRRQSTWRLLGLFVVTLGVYGAHYIKWQTAVINEHCDPEKRISDGFILSLLIVSYVSLAFFFPYMFLEEDHIISRLSDIMDRVWSIMIIVWGFKARNRMNSILSARGNPALWFHGLWTFLFTPLYFNYKINSIAKAEERDVEKGPLPKKRLQGK